MDKFPFISVVVTVYNREDTIGLCLEALLKQDYPREKFEIIVVDNNSADKTPELAKRYPVRFYTEKRRGHSFALNEGVKRAKGEIIAFIDSDAVAAGDWLRNLIQGFDDPSIGGFAGKILPYEAKNFIQRFQQDEYYNQERYFREFYLPFAVGTNAAYKHEVFEKTGLFDINLDGLEDMDFSWRMQEKTSFRLKLNSPACVYHIHRADMQAVIKKTRCHALWRVFLAKKYHNLRPGSVKVLAHLSFKTISDILKITGRTVISRAKKYSPQKKEEDIYFFSLHLAKLTGTLEGLGRYTKRKMQRTIRKIRDFLFFYRHGTLIKYDLSKIRNPSPDLLGASFEFGWLDGSCAFQLEYSEGVSLAQIKQRLESGETCYICRHEGKIIGYFWAVLKGEYQIFNFGPRYFKLSPGHAYARNLYVLPDYRNKGVGVYLTFGLVNGLNSRGFKYVEGILIWDKEIPPSLFRLYSRLAMEVKQQVHFLRFLGFGFYWQKKDTGIWKREPKNIHRS